MVSNPNPNNLSLMSFYVLVKHTHPELQQVVTTNLNVETVYEASSENEEELKGVDGKNTESDLDGKDGHSNPNLTEKKSKSDI